MIRSYERISSAKAASAFERWASLFPPGFHVNLVAYVDESGTGGNSEVLIVGGVVALDNEWKSFCKNWQRVLNKYSANYFHFREWADASAVVRKKRNPNSGFKSNPYKSWDQDTLDKFLFELSEVVVSDNKLVVGGYVPQNQLLSEQASGVAKTNASPEELCIGHFFDAVVSAITNERRVLKRQGISFFFDHSTNHQWKNTVHEVYDRSCQRHKQFKSITFVSEGLKERVRHGDLEFLPLQAADMVAYRMRQQMEKLTNIDFTGPNWDKLDNILFDRMNKANAALGTSERQAMLCRVFPGLNGVPYEQAMDAITAHGKLKHANITKK